MSRNRETLDLPRVAIAAGSVPAEVPELGAVAAAVEAAVPEDADLNAESFEYIMEGNVNILCNYTGALQNWQGCALRCRKGDNSTYRVDHRFGKCVAEKMLGSQFVDTGDLVALTAESVKTIDEFIFQCRAVKRQAKRLDTKVRDPCGRILALRVRNLMATPVAGLKVATVELKPKCGLKERQGLPSRFQMLQYEKLASGSVARISAYNPVQLLSKQPVLVHEALTNLMCEPQNNLRVFVGGRLVFSEETLEKNAGNVAISRAALDAALSQIGLPDSAGVLATLAAILGAPEMPMPDRLKRIQCWAAGDAEKLASRLYAVLQDHIGKDEAQDALTRVEHFEAALEGLADCPVDESGIVRTVELMDGLLTSVGTQQWNDELQLEVIRCLSRFLLGRTAHDVSVLINFVHVPSGQLNAVEEQLRGARFQPLDVTWSGVWFRVTVIDLDAKSPKKIPEYASQLDRSAEVYLERHGKAAADAFAVVGGHDDSIRPDGEIVWKMDQGGCRGRMELEFLRAAMDMPDTEGIVPRLLGFKEESGKRWIGMSNLLHGFANFSMADIKMGTRTWNTDASEEKCAKGRVKALQSTTGTLGVRVVGSRYMNKDGQACKVGNKVSKEVNGEAELVQFLSEFLCTEALRVSALEGVLKISAWWEAQHSYALYASSIFFAYDSVPKDICRVSLIDFGNAERIAKKVEDLSGFATGVQTLLEVLGSTAAVQQEAP